MIRFYPAIQEYYGEMLPIPATNPLGLYLRVFESGFQSYKYYRASRFTKKEKKEILERSVLYERRQYERGLTGSTPNNLWFPRDLVREISLKYLTNSKIAKRTGWRK
jgi:predicted nucleotidyltransferase